MKRQAARTLVCFWLAIAASIAAAATPAPANEEAAATLLSLINAYRNAQGQPALGSDATLTLVAERHGADMAERDYFAHVTPEGDELRHRLWNIDYRFAVAAENLARGYHDAVAVLAGWRNSPGHDRNLLRADVSRAGIAVAPSRNPAHGLVWVLVVAQPLGP